jgi:N-acetylglucosamine kinase-like BadF-type ATPase
VSAAAVLAVDGGNSKTDLALVGADGALLACVRGPLSSPHHVGLEGCLAVLEELLAEALAACGQPAGSPVVAVGRLLMAGADLPVEEAALQAAVAARGWAGSVTVGNDTFAVLRAGSARGWGVAVVCGAGINCVGVGPDGRHVRFPALGAVSGDWGGGYDVGQAALAAAARSEDGRGPVTSLERAVPAHFGLETPLELSHALHLEQIAMRSLVELAPLVLDAADDDAVAGEIVDRLAAEIVAFARAALTRLELRDRPVEVLLGGGLMRAGSARLETAIAAGLAEIGPAVVPRIVRSPPLLGAALLGLDELGAPPAAQERVRAEIDAAMGTAGPLEFVRTTTRSVADG